MTRRSFFAIGALGLLDVSTLVSIANPLHRKRMRFLGAAAYEMPYVKTFSGESYAQLWRAGPDVTPAAITSQSDGYDVMPRLSPDGTTVAFLRLDFSGAFAFRYVLCTVPFLGGSVDVIDSSTSYDCKGISWHPAGSKILYVVDPTSGQNTFHTIEPDGSNKSGALKTAPASNSIGRPTYNADGSRIAYHQTPGTPTLRVMDDDGSNDALLKTFNAGSITALGIAWANGSNTICYQLQDATNSRPYKINDDGTGDTELVTGAGNPDRPVFDKTAWLPDDSGIIVARGGGAPWELWEVDPTGGGSHIDRNVAIHADDGSWPIVRNGRIYFIRDGSPDDFVSTDLEGSDLKVLDANAGADGLQTIFLDDY